MRLKDRVAIVTGGGQGIGEAIVRRLAEEGARVAIFDVNPDGAARVAAEIGGRTYGVDVRRWDQVEAAVNKTAKDFGRIDCVVNNAGIIRDNFIHNMTPEDWDLVLETNLKGPFLVTKAAVVHMKERKYGRIVNISSRSLLGNPGQGNYSAAKGGLVSLTRTLALELGRYQITVNAVAPGLIDTPLTQGLRPDVLEKLIQQQPTGKMGTPVDIANAVLFLASDEASFITGQTIFVCGGKSVFSRAF